MKLWLRLLLALGSVSAPSLWALGQQQSDHDVEEEIYPRQSRIRGASFRRHRRRPHNKHLVSNAANGPSQDEALRETQLQVEAATGGDISFLTANADSINNNASEANSGRESRGVGMKSGHRDSVGRRKIVTQKGEALEISELVAAVSRRHRDLEIRLGARNSDGIVRNGHVFQAGSCPQAISENEAISRVHDDSLPGNTINLRYHPGGRTGNHFMTLSSYFSMAYCCRSRALVLPAEDVVLPTENGTIFRTEKRWFDFSNAVLPSPEYDSLRTRAEVCRPETIDFGERAFGLSDVHEDLLSCMNHVFVRGCEALYLGSILNTKDVCPDPRYTSKDDDGSSGRNSEEGRQQDSELARERELPRGSFEQQNQEENDNNILDSSNSNGNININNGDRDGVGSLVVHIRSGDIFDPQGQGKLRPGFGQPPLQFFLEVIGSQSWADVVILTSSPDKVQLNPTYAVLEIMAEAGALGPNVKAKKNRSLLDDLRTMLCADALAVSRSSLNFLTFAHSRATRYYIPGRCGLGTYRRMQNGPMKATPDNTTLLVLEKPEAEVYGVGWDMSMEAYSVYNEWKDTPEQLLEMVKYKGIKRLERCTL